MSRQQEPRTVSELKERAAALPDGGGLYSYSEHRDSNGTLRIEAVVIDDPAMFRSLSYRTVFPLFFIVLVLPCISLFLLVKGIVRKLRSFPCI